MGMAMVFGMHAALKDKLDDMCRQQRKITVARRQAQKEEADRLEMVRQRGEMGVGVRRAQLFLCLGA